MKIGIITIVDYSNFGNRLQNFALSYTLKNWKIKNKTIDVSIQKNEQYMVRCLKNVARFFLKNKSFRRVSNFEKFTNKYIDVISENSIKNEKIDTFIIGSDQVWNYNFPYFSEKYFGPISEQPVISYAASFGVRTIPEKYYNIYKKGLKNINKIAVRESSGIQLVKEISGKEAVVTLDPTLLLEREDWEKLIRIKASSKKRYVFLYFLDKPKDKDLKYIEKFSKKNNCKMFFVGFKDYPLFWKCSPEGFVKIISEAYAVFTDSFHACVFSIIFEKKFEIFQRNTKLPSTSSRINTLFSLLKLESRWHKDNGEVIYEKIDYKEVKKILKIEKEKSLFFLEKAINSGK